MRQFGLRYKLRQGPNSEMTVGLLAASLLTDGGSDLVYNAARVTVGAQIIGSSSVYWQAGPEGMGYSSRGSDYILFGTGSIYSPAPNPYSAVCRCVMADLTQSVSNYGKVWGTWTNPQSSPYQNWGIFHQNGVIGVSMGNTNGPIDLFLDAVPVGTVHTIMQTWDGTTLRGYLDGIFVASTVISPTTGMVTGTLAVGGNPGNVHEFWPAPVYMVALWNRCLSASEVLTHAQDPYWSLFDAGSASLMFPAVNIPPGAPAVYPYTQLYAPPIPGWPEFISVSTKSSSALPKPQTPIGGGGKETGTHVPLEFMRAKP